MPDSLPILHDAATKRFEYSENGHTAFIEYSLMHGSIAFLHTVVPDSMAGRGIAGQLTEYAFHYAKEKDLPVIVYCPYIESYIKKHPELQKQLDPYFLN